MKLDKVILSCTDDYYFDYFEIVSLAWKEIGVEPVLFLIGDSNKKAENIINFNIKNIDKAFMSQNIRLLGPSLFPDDVCLISDIDMMPMSKKYFQENIKSYSEDSFILYRDKATKDTMYPICYNAAKGSLWGSIFAVNNINEIKDTLEDWFSKQMEIEERSWYFDQIILKKYLDQYYKLDNKKFIKLDDADTGWLRLNRTDLKFRFKKFYNPNLNYTDFHMPVPYLKNKKIIDRVFESNFKIRYS